MKWKQPPINKVYEALGAIADERIEVVGNTAKVYSSSRGKYYDVTYDPASNAITANDNASYYAGYLGYPSIAFLLKAEVVKYDQSIVTYFKGFAWKDINQKFKNDFAKTDAYIDGEIADHYGVDIDQLHAALDRIFDAIISLRLNKLATTKKPPKGY